MNRLDSPRPAGIQDPVMCPLRSIGVAEAQAGTGRLHERRNKKPALGVTGGRDRRNSSEAA